MGNIWRTFNVVHGLKHESIYTYVSRHIRVCYCRLNISTKELVLSYFSGDAFDMIMISHICALYTPNRFVYIHITVIIVMIWLMYKEIVKPLPLISLFKSCYVLWLPAWWALWLPWWPPAGCNNALMYLLIFTMNFCHCFIVVFCWK